MGFIELFAIYFLISALLSCWWFGTVMPVRRLDDLIGGIFICWLWPLILSMLLVLILAMLIFGIFDVE